MSTGLLRFVVSSCCCLAMAVIQCSSQWAAAAEASEAGSTRKEQLVPLVIWPGMGDSCCYVFGAAGYKGVIERMLPGIYIKLIAFGKSAQEDTYNSFFLNANTQVDLACQLLSSDPKLRDGFNAMGFSQGAQFLRALVQRCDRVKIYNLISVGGQHQGVYGFPFCMGESSWFCDLFRQFLSIGVYLTIFQDYIVQASYWHDPHDEESYQLDCLFLSDINQEVTFNPLYKERLSNLSNLVLIKFDQDMMVQPRETQWFGFYKPGQAVETYSLYESKQYTKDLLGLQYLHSNGRLHLLSSPNGHTLLTYDWLDLYIIPFIKRTQSDVRRPVSIRADNNSNVDRYTSISSASSNVRIIGSIAQPSFIHIASDGNVFVSSYKDRLIYQFDSSGNLLRELGPVPGESGAHGVTVFEETLYVANNGNSVYRYSLQTGQYDGIAYRTNESSEPFHGVTVDSQGLLYVSQGKQGSVHVVNQRGERLMNLSNVGRSPQKVQFDSEDNLRVTDAVDSNIYVVTRSDQLLHRYPTHLSSPHGLFVDREDVMMVADREGGVSVYDKHGKCLHDIGGFEGCSDVQVSLNGTVWVTDTTADRVYLFQL